MRKSDWLDTPSVRVMNTKVERRLKEDQDRASENTGSEDLVSVEKLARIGVLVENAAQGMVSSFVGVIVYVIVATPYMRLSTMLVWGGCMIALTAFRWWLHSLQKADTSDAGRRRWLRFYGVGATVNGLGWALGLLLGMTAPNVEMHALCAFMMAGVVAGAVPLTSAIPAVFISFVLAIGIPFTIMALSPWYSGPPTMALIAAVFLVVLINVGLLYSRTLARAILSDHDILTSLLNRRAFDRTLRQFANENNRQSDGGVLCYLDIDRFKTINDTYGHAAGDQFICDVAKIMESNVRSNDVLARFGGDEFAILLRSHSIEDGKQVAERIRKSIEEHDARWEGRRISTTASMGVVVIKPGTSSVRAVTTAADTALYTAKHLGRNRVHFHDPDDELERQRRDEIQWVRRLREGFIDQRLRLAIQEIFTVSQADGNTKKRYEILLRLLSSDSEVISAGKFMSAAERYGLTPILDRWVVDHTVRWLSQNREFTEDTEWCAINVSSISLADDRFSRRIKRIFKKYDVPPSKICFEISEATVLQHREVVMAFCEELRPLGCRFSIDGCGRAMDVLSYLKEVKADLLKIDGQFVSNLLEDKQAASVVQAINDIGHGYGMSTIAGFVENENTLQRLELMGIDFAQGFGLDRPVILDIKEEKESERAA